MNIPNITRTVELPADFEAEANRLGYTESEYIWLLAENAIARHPKAVKEITLPDLSALAASLIPFPLARAAA